METTEPVIDIPTDVQDNQTVLVNLLDAIDASEAKLEDAPALLRKLINPPGHLRESDSAADLHHSERAILRYDGCRGAAVCVNFCLGTFIAGAVSRLR